MPLGSMVRTSKPLQHCWYSSNGNLKQSINVFLFVYSLTIRLVASEKNIRPWYTNAIFYGT